MAHRSFLPPIDVTSINSPRKSWEAFLSIGSPQSRISEKRNEATASPRWKPTEKHKKFLKMLSEAGLRNPTPEDIADIVGVLKVDGDVEEKNVFYWFQNVHSRNRRKEQKNALQAGSQYQKEMVENSVSPICSSSTPGKLYVFFSVF